MNRQYYSAVMLVIVAVVCMVSVLNTVQALTLQQQQSSLQEPKSSSSRRTFLTRTLTKTSSIAIGITLPFVVSNHKQNVVHAAPIELLDDLAMPTTTSGSSTEQGDIDQVRCTSFPFRQKKQSSFMYCFLFAWIRNTPVTRLFHRLSIRQEIVTSIDGLCCAITKWNGGRGMFFGCLC
jgi:hypothetical protein